MGHSDFDAVIVSYARSPIGKAHKGSFKDGTIDMLLSSVVMQAIKKAHVGPEVVEECIFGNVLSPNNGTTEVRATMIECGIPLETPVMVVNRQCSSGLDALDIIASKIRNGRISVGLAGGFEIMSQNMIPKSFCISTQSLASEKARSCFMSMGDTSEELARRFGIKRKDADLYACRSQEKAAYARDSGFFDSEIAPIHAKDRMISVDEGVRETEIEKVSILKPVFVPSGISTAGNSSQLSDGTAAVLLMSRKKAQELGISILGVFVDFVSVGCDPAVMGIGPSVAIPKLLKRNNLSIEDIDAFEINEAFAVQVLYCIRKLKIPEKKVNLFGGAIALGHPLGCTGSRITCTLLNIMERNNYKLGVVSLCVGTGMGVAALIRRE